MNNDSRSAPSIATLKRLYALSGNRCAYPKCRVKIVEGDAMVGAVCHIRAASLGGPRFDSSQTATLRHSLENLILLCANHHRVIDDDVEAYSVQRLEKMKADHENAVAHLSDAEASAGASLLMSVNQSGGIVAHHIQTINIMPADSSLAAHALPVSAGMTFAGMDDVLAHMGASGQEKYKFNTMQFVYLRLIPPNNRPPLGMPRLLEVFKQARILPMSHSWSGTAARNKCGAMYYVEQRQREISALTQGFTSGELWGMNGVLFQSQSVPAQPGEPEGRILIVPSVAMEKLYVETLNNYVQVAQKVFELPLPYTVELGIKGVEHAHVSFPRVPAGLLRGPIFEPAFRRVYTLSDSAPDAMNALLSRYFDEFYSELVGYTRKDMMVNDFIDAHGLPRTN